MARTIVQKHACVGCPKLHGSEGSPEQPQTTVRKLRSNSTKSVKEKSVSKNTEKNKITGKKSKVKEKQSLPKKDESVQESNKRILRSRIPRNIKRKSLVNNSVQNKTKKVVKRVLTNEKLRKSRQLSLAESFSNQSRKVRLRKSTEPKGKVPVEEKPSSQKSKVPVYKSAKLEESIKNKNEIYDFNFDMNDSKERVRKKKPVRKKTVRKTSKKTIQTKKNKLQAPKNVPDVAENAEKKESTNVQNVIHDNVKDNVESPDSSKLPDQPLEPVKSNEETPVTKSTDVINKPTITDMKRVTMIPTILKPNEFKRFQPTNIFNNNQTVLNTKSVMEYKNMLNHSLLNKTVSPIVKPVKENFDPGSPWRPPLCTFSQVKSLFQSTPQNNKVDVFHGKVVRNLNNDINYVKASQTNAMQRNENILTQRTTNKSNTSNKIPVTSRRFGTEITNVNQSAQPSISNTTVQINERTAPDAAPTTSIGQSTTAINTINITEQFNDVAEDKENTVPNQQTPRKSPKKKTKQNRSVFSPPQRSSATKTSLENIDPQPGPSGLQKLKNPDEQRVLQQSNLNNFLNLMEMPQSTRISSFHGIFNDAHSTPINGKPIKKMKTNSELNIENAFGFSDEDSNELDVSPIGTNAPKGDGKHKLVKPHTKVATAARLSVGEIKNKLLKKSRKRKIEVKDVTEEEPEKIENVPIEEKKRGFIDTVSFSDTFDVLSETGEIPKDVNPPLFAELEPTHFTKPPTHSYKRKYVKFNFNDDSMEDEDFKEPKIKRKKQGILNKKEKKRLENWVKSVNETFDEIEQFDLVIE